MRQELLFIIPFFSPTPTDDDVNPMWFTETDAWIDGEYCRFNRTVVPCLHPSHTFPSHQTQHQHHRPTQSTAVDGVESSSACYTLLNGTYNAYCACRLGKFVFEEECDAGAYVANEVALNLPTYFLMVICIVWGSQVRAFAPGACLSTHP